MVDKDVGGTMNQAIFRLGLTTETVSVYLLGCGLADAGLEISTETLGRRWNGTPEELDTGLETLEKRHIFERVRHPDGSGRYYRINEPERWE